MSFLFVILLWFNVGILYSGTLDPLLHVHSFSDCIHNEAFPFLVALILFNLIVFMLFFLSGFLKYIIPAIPLYIMAYNAGYNKPWLVFIPYGKTYVSLMLPITEYSYIGWFKTYNRKTVFWTYFALDLFESLARLILSYVPLIGSILNFAYMIGKKLIHFGEYKDILATYGRKDSAGWIAGIGIFFPIVYWIFLYISCRKEPDFGFNRYYDPKLPDQNSFY